ncbi:DNA repair protein rad5 [Golovinomyces cichoracearum]|uniref:DNA repair protein rad5 n=1 Tax=Golovinomyces cichoracearum TaxID=62708 RepID=A0A420IWQ0_9PEZI|nr:DNA repair protein rad5 [Golovinomyces cichoracearum]
MYSTNPDKPPLKKRVRREHSGGSTNDLNQNFNSDILSSNSALLKSNFARKLQENSSNSNHVSLKSLDGCSTEVPIGFEQAAFEALVEENVTPKVLSILREASGGRLEKAVNLYYDGFCDNLSHTKPKNQNPFTKTSASEHTGTEAHGVREQKTKRIIPLQESIPESRYIGAFGCEGWVTRGGLSLLKHGDLVRIERQKIRAPKSSNLKSKSGSSAIKVIPRPNSIASRRVDVLVRFTNSKGEEIGRIPQNHADWMSTLIDQKVCKFEGSCVYAPEKLRSGDTLFLQLRSYLLCTAFDDKITNLTENRTIGINEEKESFEEKQLRQKQTSLLRLFQEINLLPCQTPGTTKKDKYEGIIQAAEAADRHEKNKKISPNSNNESISNQAEESEDGKELEQEQLDTLYKKAQSFDFNAPIAEPADSFAMNLRHYQKQALHWMISREQNSRNPTSKLSMHPLWEEYSWPTRDADGEKLPQFTSQERLYVNPYSGELSLKFPVQEQQCLGGILADEMGLGKTIEMMSLIHSHKSENLNNSNYTSSSSKNNFMGFPVRANNVIFAPWTTLVVAPMSLLSQWQGEAEAASKEASLKSIVYYGSDKSYNLQNICRDACATKIPNVIITSYGVILSEYNQIVAKNGDKSSLGGLFSIKYFRVILDEAHHIKNRQSKSAKACYQIEAEHRWALTGTPIVNRLEDLFSLVRFLRVDPWSNFSFWRTFITTPYESKDFLRALDVVQTVLDPLVLRRTKDMKTPSGEALVPLPPKKVELISVELSKPEREVYDHILNRAKQSFEANLEAGTVLKAYTSIFAHVMRLRQSCCHPVLTRNLSIVADEEEAALATDAVSGLSDDMTLQSLIERFTAETSESTDSDNFGAYALQQIQDDAENECPICSEEPMIERVVTSCWHSTCKKCLLEYMNHQIEKGEKPRCVTCREPLDTRNLFEVVKEEDLDCGSPRYSLHRLGSTSSAKITILLSHLKRLKRDAPGTKSVVFSQFTSFLSLIEPVLSQASIPFMRLDGSMAQKTRAAVLSGFASSKDGIVLLLSLRAGGVGLNLTMAKRVYMMDPWWSFAVEAQAIDRVHRMGQTDEVKVYRFIVQNSVEERMLKIQDRKKFIASSLGMMNDAEKKLQRLEDIKELLS